MGCTRTMSFFSPQTKRHWKHKQMRPGKHSGRGGWIIRTKKLSGQQTTEQIKKISSSAKIRSRSDGPKKYKRWGQKWMRKEKVKQGSSTDYRRQGRQWSRIYQYSRMRGLKSKPGPKCSTQRSDRRSCIVQVGGAWGRRNHKESRAWSTGLGRQYWGEASGRTQLKSTKSTISKQRDWQERNEKNFSWSHLQ